MSYNGGKGGAGVYQQIINQMPPHGVYIEAFSGGASVLRHKRPAPLANIAVDLDSAARHHAESAGAQFVHGDALAYLRAYPWRGGELVYLDPPYPASVRSSKRPIYQCEMLGLDSHRELLDLLVSLPCMVLISGYWSELYEVGLPDWRSITFPSVTRSGRVAEEWLWMNFAAPTALHDISYAGNNYRERERIKRKAARWRARLAAMDCIERSVIVAAVEEISARSLTAAAGEGGRRLVPPPKTARAAVQDPAPSKTAMPPIARGLHRYNWRCPTNPDRIVRTVDGRQHGAYIRPSA